MRKDGSHTFAILDGEDPSKILQRGTELLFPETPWELERRTGGSDSRLDLIRACDMTLLPGDPIDIVYTWVNSSHCPTNLTEYLQYNLCTPSLPLARSLPPFLPSSFHLSVPPLYFTNWMCICKHT